ncbi:ABC transporter permease [Luteimicrobium sp. DT211]|uniref:ABC transporter permease n=1 Tax=Luteimicrobium sp. DT211 TaxID=3393412 RepID=UPI003CE8C378
MSAVAAPTRAGRTGAPERRRRPWWTAVLWIVVGFFFLNLVALVASVVVDSFGTKWFGTWLPEGWTLHWYTDAWSQFGLSSVLLVTIEVAVAVIVLSVLIGVPASYALARRSFPGKRLLMVLFVLPILVPPITYGIPLATLLYKLHLAGTLSGVIVANLVPSVPFVILTMTPFIEQIDPKVEAAARMCGARTTAVFLRILTPLLVPGILAASILVLVRTVGMFELTFLTAGPTSTTLVVTLYNAVFAAGIRANQSVDAMATIYTGAMLVLLVVALRFVNPTQLVTRVGDAGD